MIALSKLVLPTKDVSGWHILMAHIASILNTVRIGWQKGSTTDWAQHAAAQVLEPPDSGMRGLQSSS